MSASSEESTFGRAARWAWMPLLLIALLLLSRLQRLRQENDTARGALQTIDRQTTTLLAEAAAALAPASVSPTPPASASTNSAAKPKPPPGALAYFSDMNVMGDPELGPPVVRRNRRYAMGNYRKAIEALHLSPQDEEKLRQLIVERWNAAIDARDVVDRMANPPGGLRNKAVEAAQQAGDHAIKEFLGDTAYAQFRTANEVWVNKTTNWMLFTALWDAGMPVSDEQETAYAQALQQVNKQFPTPESRGPADPQTGLTQADVALLGSLESTLTPEQIALIRDERIRSARQMMLEREKHALTAKN